RRAIKELNRRTGAIDLDVSVFVVQREGLRSDLQNATGRGQESSSYVSNRRGRIEKQRARRNVGTNSGLVDKRQPGAIADLPFTLDWIGRGEIEIVFRANDGVSVVHCVGHYHCAGTCQSEVAGEPQARQTSIRVHLQRAVVVERSAQEEISIITERQTA